MIDLFNRATGPTPVRPGGDPVRGRRAFAFGSRADRRVASHEPTWEERSVTLFARLVGRDPLAPRGGQGAGTMPRADDAAAPCARIRNPFPMAEDRDACAATGAWS